MKSSQIGNALFQRCAYVIQFFYSFPAAEAKPYAAMDILSVYSDGRQGGRRGQAPAVAGGACGNLYAVHIQQDH